MSESFYQLDPEFLMTSLEASGFAPTGEYTQLNSYENRVFDIRLEKGQSAMTQDERIIAKFYRPGRWSLQTILDEHRFLDDLHKEGIFAVTPLLQKDGSTLSGHDGIYLAVFPKVLGRNPQELFPSDRKKIGRTLARIHNVGSLIRADHRHDLTIKDYGRPALEKIKELIAPEVRARYLTAAQDICDRLDDLLEPDHFIRIHGDCHRGNLLLRDEEFYFVDFDDFCNGPEAQDFWMLLDSAADESQTELNELLAGYTELRDFDEFQLELFEPLRGLRIMHYASWIARRWEDPSFPRLFPEFGTYNYWVEETEALERIAWSL